MPRSAWVLIALVLIPALATADDAVPQIPAAQVEEALAQAGANRPRIQEALDHFEKAGDARKLVAIRFLVANMPGKGYVVTALKDEKGQEIPFDPLAYPDFGAAQKALDEIEKAHGKVDFDRSRLVFDLETVSAEFLIRHVDHAFEAWQRTPASRRVTFQAFLDYVLPYRGSEEPVDDWLTPMLERTKAWAQVEDPREVWKQVNALIGGKVKFGERFYLHPTDQGFGEMEKSCEGRCEDITNMTTFAARAAGLATAADYTPAWGHRDNNHAWNVLLDASGRGSEPSNAHAAKVYRKTFALQRGNLAFLLPEGREAPNRFLGSKSYLDVTDQYAATTDVAAEFDDALADPGDFAYLCVFNGGEWVAIQWGRVETGRVTFPKMGRGLLYLPALHVKGALLPVLGPPLLVAKDGTVRPLPGKGAPASLVATAVSPEQVSPDTKEVTPVSHLVAGTTYVLQRWTGDWSLVKEFVAGPEAPRFDDLPSDGLYWLVAKDSRKLERPFTIENGRQRFW